MKIPFPENPLAERKKVRIAVRLKNKGAQAVRKGHPWVFEDSVEKLSRDGAAGSVAVLYDGKSNSVLGAGLYDPRSQVRVKVLSYGSKNPPVGKPLFLA